MPTLRAPRALVPIALVPIALGAASLAAQQAPDSASRAADTSRALDAAGASRVVLDSAALAGAPMRSFSDALAARVPGLSVLRSSGTAGTGSRVRLRSAGGLLATDEPLLVIDGVRADAEQASLGVGVGGQQPSRLDDVAIEDVERVEILMGPAAAWRYGTGGANGAIVVTTRRGRRGPARWRLLAAGGVATDATDYPANHQTPGTRVSDGAAVDCPLADAADGTCRPSAVESWNPLERARPFRTAPRQQLAASVGGGVGRVTYYAGAGLHDERGVLDGNDVRRATIRASVTARPRDELRVTVAGGYLDGRTHLPPGDGIGVLVRGLLGSSRDDPTYRGYDSLIRYTLPPMRQDVGRLTASLAAEWQPRRRLGAVALVGLDNVNRVDERHSRTPAFVGAWRIGHETADEHDRRVTARAEATAEFGSRRAVAATTAAGIEIDRTKLLESARSRFEIEGSDLFSESRRRFYATVSTTGLYLRQRLTWTERRVLGVGVRTDRPHHLIALDRATYRSADASWALGDEPFFPRIPGVSRLRVRAAYGEAGDLRPVMAVIAGEQFLVPLPNSPSLPSGSARPRWKVPRASERELGADVAVLGGRLELEVTRFRKTRDDEILVFPSSGVDFIPRPVGGNSWRNDGTEALLTACLLDRTAVRWDASLAWATNRGELRDLAGPPFPVSQLNIARTLLRPGYPLGGLWMIPYAYADLNGDGVIVPGEMSVPVDETGSPVVRYMGHSIPTREASVSSRIRLFERLTLSALLDYHGGHRKLNLTEATRCWSGLCRDIHVPGSSLSGQARGVAVRRINQVYGTIFTGYFEDASFTRLREVVATVELPAAWGRPLGARGMSVTLAGRNLATWTSYTGLDPEVSGSGQAGAALHEYATQPLLRSLAARLDITW